MEPIYIKETLINISSTAMFTSPVICILWPQYWKYVAAQYESLSRKVYLTPSLTPPLPRPIPTASLFHRRECLGLTIGMLALTMLYPPVGSWMRPHRHSDIAQNRAGLPNK